MFKTKFPAKALAIFSAFATSLFFVVFFTLSCQSLIAPSFETALCLEALSFATSMLATATYDMVINMSQHFQFPPQFVS